MAVLGEEVGWAASGADQRAATERRTREGGSEGVGWYWKRSRKGRGGRRTVVEKNQEREGRPPR